MSFSTLVSSGYMRWMNLEPIIQSEVSQKEKDKYRILTHNIQNREKWLWRIYLQGNNGETDIENRLKDMGRGEERVRCMERVTRKLNITMCKIDSCRKIAVWLRKLKQGLCINLEGWDGEGDGREIQKGGDACIHIYGWFMLRFDRKQQNSVKQLPFNKIISKKWTRTKES